jgi:hypothetical protein
VNGSGGSSRNGERHEKPITIELNGEKNKKRNEVEWGDLTAQDVGGISKPR